MRKKDYCDRIFLFKCLYSHFEKFQKKKLDKQNGQAQWFVLFPIFALVTKKNWGKKVVIRKKIAKNLENIPPTFRNHKIEKTQWEG